jgi:hypothetical protein
VVAYVYVEIKKREKMQCFLILQCGGGSGVYPQ